MIFYCELIVFGAMRVVGSKHLGPVSLVKPLIHVVVGLSGGVDSSVAAQFLQRCVHTDQDITALLCHTHSPLPLPQLLDAMHQRLPWSSVIGSEAARAAGDAVASVCYHPLYMSCWEGEDEPCESSRVDYTDAETVAHYIGMLPETAALPTIDLQAAYINDCFNPMLKSYAGGGTLNVDVLCNEKIKFDALLKHAQLQRLIQRKEKSRQPVPLSRIYLATGHYARVLRDPARSGASRLVSPFTAKEDSLNNQVHFLARVHPIALSQALFPLGYLFTSKKNVRLAAHRMGLNDVVHKKTSTGICMVPKRSAVRSLERENCGISLRFPQLLDRFVPPPFQSTAAQPQARRTCRFFLQTTTAPVAAHETLEEIPFGDLLFSSKTQQWLEEALQTGLPAYAFTVGQRVLHRRKLPCGKVQIERYYVIKKCFFSGEGATSDADGAACEDLRPALALSAVLLVRDSQHPSMFASRVKLNAFVWSDSRFKDASAVTCLCAVRHQQPLQIATIFQSEEERNESKATVRWETASGIRAPLQGQLLVAYLPAGLNISPRQAEPSASPPLSSLGSSTPQTPPQLADLDAFLRGPDRWNVVQIASGWIV